MAAQPKPCRPLLVFFFGEFLQARSHRWVGCTGAVGKFLGSAHPRFGPNRLHPIRKGRNEAEIFQTVLFSDPPERHQPSGRNRNGRAEYGLGHEDPLGIVPQRPVAESGGDLLRLVKPVVDAEVVFDYTARSSY